MTKHPERPAAPNDHANLSRQIIAYIALVFLFSSLPYAIIIHTRHLAVGSGMLVFLLMWCPALAAITTCFIFRIDIATLGWRWRPVRLEAWAYALPVLYSLPVYLITWLTITGSFAFSAFASQEGTAFGFPHSARAATWLLAIPCYASVGVLGSMAHALGEEIGWRGFLLPRLVGRVGFTLGCLISGCIWALWHYPLLLFADYNVGTPRLFALSCFTCMVIGDAFIFGWFRLKSGSLWPAAMLHASHNLFIQALLDRMTNPVGKALYITTEFGAGLALTVAAFAFYLWTRRGEVEHLALAQSGLKQQEKDLSFADAPADRLRSAPPS